MKRQLQHRKFDLLEQRANFRAITLMHGYFKTKYFDRFSEHKVKQAYVLEGRPRLESSKIICQELIRRDVKPTIISDNMAGFLFEKNMVREVWLTYVTKDKDSAVCLIGSLILAVLAFKHHVPVYLSSSIKQIEPMGKEKEIFQFLGEDIAPKGIKGYVPLLEEVPLKYLIKPKYKRGQRG